MHDYHWNCSFINQGKSVTVTVKAETHVADTRNTSPVQMAHGVFGPVLVKCATTNGDDEAIIKSHKELLELNKALANTIEHYVKSCDEIILEDVKPGEERCKNQQHNICVIEAYKTLVSELLPNFLVMDAVLRGQNTTKEEVWLVDENNVKIESNLPAEDKAHLFERDKQ